MEERVLFEDVDRYGPQKRQGSLSISTEEIDRDELEQIDRINVDVVVRQGDLPGEYIAEGEIGYTADLRCGRCVDPFPVATTSTFALRYRARPEGFGTEEEEREITGEELDVEYYSDRSVSLREIATEQVHLSIPMKPLCEEACLGLCPSCGANLNRQGCSCQIEQTDERWAALQDIRAKMTNKKQS